MSTDSGRSQPGGAPSLSEITGMLREVTGETPAWAGRITLASRLEDDLRLDSLELTALDTLLRRRYGAGVDLSGHLASMSLDDLIVLTVGDLLAFLAAATVTAAATATAASREPVR